jgi:hypothetical protein
MPARHRAAMSPRTGGGNPTQVRTCTSGESDSALGAPWPNYTSEYIAMALPPTLILVPLRLGRVRLPLPS